MPCKILISTTVDWTSTARHAAGFVHAGCHVEAVAPDRAPVALSRYVSVVHRYRPISALSSLRRAIIAAQPDAIVSCDDRAVENLLRLYRREPKDSAVARVIERSLGTPAEYGNLMSREPAMRIAHALGIRTPDTLPVLNVEALDDCLTVTGLPAVLKVDGSWGGDGVVVAKTRAEARAAYNRLAYPLSRLRCLARAARRRDGHWLVAAVRRTRRPVSIQRFVPGRPAASAFAAWGGEVVGAVYYDMLKTDGPSGPPSVIRRVDCPEIAEATRLIAKHFGLSGLHGLDFIRDEKGRAHLLEINPRATQGGTLAFGPGRDLAAALTACIAPDAETRPAIANDVVVFFPREWSLDPASEYLRIGYHDVPWDDPLILRACLDNMACPPPRDRAAGVGTDTAQPLNPPIPLAAASGARA